MAAWEGCMKVLFSPLMEEIVVARPPWERLGRASSMVAAESVNIHHYGPTILAVIMGRSWYLSKLLPSPSLLYMCFNSVHH